MRCRPVLLVLLIVFCAVLTACALPPLANRIQSSALPEAEARATRLGQAFAPLADAHPGQAGVYALRDAREAFGARMALVRAADRTLDVQYYIWHADRTGTLLFEALRAAAERGVRVRLLLDDNNTTGLDPTLAALAAQPNFEVRLFNPFAVRAPRLFGYVFDFSIANRRMHNKSFTADNQATIVGGRNIGDEYFDAKDGVLFTDLDALVTGDVVRDVSNDFDRYWRSGSAYPAERIVPPATKEQRAALQAAAAAIEADPEAQAYVDAIRDSAFVGELRGRTLPFEWAHAELVSDDPAKGLAEAPREALVTHELKQIIGRPVTTVDLVSPYFVPGTNGRDAFATMARRGVGVRVLTNSLESTDVVAVHAGYAKHRRELLEAGVTLYEMRREAAPAPPAGRKGRFQSSGASLHAKTFSVDRSRVFIGSFNFDPRSARLNTEMGLVIESPELAERIDRTFDDEIPRLAYEVRQGDDGRLVWIERGDGREVRHESEPGATFWKRLGISILSLLPIDWLL